MFRRLLGIKQEKFDIQVVNNLSKMTSKHFTILNKLPQLDL